MGKECCSVILEAVKTWEERLAARLMGLKFSPGSLALTVNPEENLLDPAFHCSGHHSTMIGLTSMITMGSSISSNLNVCESLERPGVGHIAHELFPDSISSSEDIASHFSFPLQRIPSGDAASAQAMNTIRIWTRSCTREGHRYCPDKASTEIRTRILELAEGRYYLREHTDVVDRLPV